MTQIIISHFALAHRMTNSQRLAKVRNCLLHWIANQQRAQGSDEQTPPVQEPVVLREAILIRDEFFCGRRFYTEHHQAVWFIEEDVLKIYDSRGDLLCVFSGTEIDADRFDAEVEAVASILKLPIADVPAADSEPSTRRAA